MPEKLKSFYFRHDENAANDIKLMMLRSQLAMEGYGIYWFLIEQLSMAGGRMQLKILPMLATMMQTTPDKVLSVVKNYELFTLDEDGFFSERLNKELEKRGTLSEAGRIAGLKSAEIRKNKQIESTTVERPLNEPETTVEQIPNDRSTSIGEKRIEEDKIGEKKDLSTTVDGVIKNEFEKSILAIIQSIKSELKQEPVRDYKITPKRIRMIATRKKEFHKAWGPERDFLKACKFAFAYKAKEWFGKDTFQYFEPETLLSEKFISYLEKAEQDKGEPYRGEPKHKEEEKVTYTIPK